MTTNPKDSGGNVRVDFVWGPFPVQPDEARTVLHPSGDPFDFGVFVGSDVLDSTKDSHNIATGNYNGYPANDLATLVEVDDYRGLTQEAAVTAIEDAGLVASVAYGTFLDPVWGQYPTPGSEIAPGGTVHLTGTPSTKDTSDTITVPDVVGDNLADAKAALEELGFVVSPSAWPTHRVDPVTAQSPEASKEALFGSTVALTGTAQVQVANVVGETLANAKTALEDQGFVVSPSVWGAGKEDPVTVQSPVAGTWATPGATVTLTGTTSQGG